MDANAEMTMEASAPPTGRDVDVLIVGAGISGIGAAYQMTQQRPSDSFVVLESYESFGGTWWMHRYPGVRSDSDLYTFGYRFKPWTGAPIATADEILKYMGEVIEDNGLAAHIRYSRKVQSAKWDSRTNRWSLEVSVGSSGEVETYTCRFLWMCQGYYRHASGYTPDWPGMEDFKGRIVHPQTWPDDLDYKNKRVVIIGSGATTATVAPAIAADCAHVTVVQRSPTYFIPGRNANELADILRELEVDEAWIHEITRRKILHDQEAFTRRALAEPEAVKAELLAGISALLPADYDVQTHFTPRYRPWRQRIAFVPEGDLFQGISSGKVTIATDEIDRFTPSGLRLASGREVEADIIITATGFNLSVLGDIDFSIDRKPLNLAESVTYRGMMFTGVPNLVWIFGYFRASWTLRVDLVADFVCRLLTYMAEHGYTRVEPAPRAHEVNMKLSDWIDPENFNPNYLLRSMHLLPKSGEGPDWRHTQDYWREKDELPAIDLSDPVFRYS